MSKEAKVLTQTLGCSELVARELITTGLEVARYLCDLTDVWDFKLMLEAKRMASVMWWEKPRDKHGLTYDPKICNERREDKAKRTRRKLSYAAQKMFKRFEEAEAAWQKFRLARHMVEELRQQPDSELLTTVFGICHEHRKLAQPEKVIEGRTLFEAMWRDSELLRDVGSIPLLD